jgi:hypothetical protein
MLAEQLTQKLQPMLTLMLLQTTKILTTAVKKLLMKR